MSLRWIIYCKQKVCVYLFGENLELDDWRLVRRLQEISGFTGFVMIG